MWDEDVNKELSAINRTEESTDEIVIDEDDIFSDFVIVPMLDVNKYNVKEKLNEE